MPLTTRSTNLVRPRSLIIGGSSMTCKSMSKASWTSLAVVHGTFTPAIGAMSNKFLHNITRITSSNSIRIRSPQLSCDVLYKCLRKFEEREVLSTNYLCVESCGKCGKCLAANFLPMVNTCCSART